EDMGRAHPQLVLQGMDFGVDVDRRAGACATQLLDLGLQFGDGLLEIEEIRIHRIPSVRKAGSLADWEGRARVAFRSLPGAGDAQLQGRATATFTARMPGWLR